MWRIEDIVDLEYFFSHARSGEMSGQTGAAHLDRQIFLGTILPQVQEQANPSRRLLLKLWLDHRRQHEKKRTDSPVFLPGSAYVTVQRLLFYGLGMGGFLAGANLALYFLKYDGTEPINVFLYVSVLVLFQIVLSLLVSVVFLLNRLGISFFNRSPLYSLAGLLAARIISWARQKTRTQMNSEQRSAFDAVLGLISGRRRIYGTLFFWPLFVLFQTGGVCFNLGVVGTTLIKVAATDLAFGWQSTLQLSPEAIYSLVSTVSMPWSWLVSAGAAHPSLAQIEGSRMILKEGLYHLATADLVAWWPFMVFSVCCYGLLPRALFLLAGLSSQRRVLEQLDFSHSDCDRLISRLTTAQVVTESSASPEGATVKRSLDPVGVVKGALGHVEVVALVPDDIFDDLDQEEFAGLARENLGLDVTAALPFAEQENALRQLAEIRGKGDGGALLVLFEGWQPPIQEDLSFLQAMRGRAEEKTPIILVLTGKPVSGKLLTRPSALEWSVWNRKCASLGDPFLRLEKLVPDNG